jgi:type II restriction/modification system DNA methylase subunit YeeA
MNKNTLKSFARAARRKLMEQVTSKLNYVLTTDSAELRNKQNQIDELKKQIAETTKDDVIEKVAYTWFNRFAALRFMDANGYTPIKIVSPAEGFTTPELLAEAKKGHIEENLRIDRTKINDLLDGRIPARDPQNEIYQMLLVATCNAYHKIMPFMFEPINDYTELLMPDDLISQNSVLSDVVNNMTEEDCQDVEIIGWLYQYYISEKKDEVIGAKKRYTPQEIPAATQLFTPQWIVKYMVENTLGQLWLEARPHSKIRKVMEFYIEPADKNKLPLRQINSPEDLKLCDPCVGSAHILAYEFDILTKIYEEEGYDPQEIPRLILTKNLYGIEIDDRAASLASFALFMKARGYDRNFFSKPVQPNVLALQNIKFGEDELNQYVKEMGANLFTANLKQALGQFEHAKTIGSLIRPAVVSVDDILKELTSKDLGGNLFLAGTHQKVLKALKQILYLQEKYDCVITNPPYVNSGYMNETISDFVKTFYPNTKADLFACFLIRCRELSNSNGMIGFVSPYVWMFIQSYQWLRENVIENCTINNLIQLEYNAFEPACVPVCTFTLRNKSIDLNSEYIKLTDFKGHEKQPIKTLEAIQKSETDYRFTANQKDFQKIPGTPIAFWLSEKSIKAFIVGDKLESKSIIRQGCATGNNDLFVRNWHEISVIKFNTKSMSVADALNSGAKWFPYNKGGNFRKWYGNLEFVIAFDHINYKLLSNSGNNLPSKELYFKKAITWTAISSSNFSVRLHVSGSIFSNAGMVCIVDDTIFMFTIGFLSSNVAKILLEALSPTLNYNAGDIKKIPILPIQNNIQLISNSCIDIANKDWDFFETSWDFTGSPMLSSDYYRTTLNDTYNQLRAQWLEMTFEMQRFEQENNRIFIETYELKNGLTPHVPLEEITLTCNPYYRYGNNKSKEELEALLLADTMKELISYSIGCMFGRYSLDKEGLILANQGETIDDYLKVVPNPTFEPDADNIIPILEDEYFTDDIVGRFKTFLKVSFGAEHYEENLEFIEDAIGKDIRSYFVRDFYKDHIKRYKKRPIYWLFSSSNRGFNALIYMHRYRPDTVSTLLNDYVREFITKLESRRIHFNEIRLSESCSTRDRKLADKELTRIERLLKELRDYERDVLYPLAAQRIEIDLDDGVKVNYFKFGEALYPIPGLCK